MDEVRVGIIGVGGMGTEHARYLRSGEVKRCRLTAVCDVVPERLAPFQDELKTFPDSAALIRSGEVDAVLIATPHYDHTSIGIDALEQGLHVLTEKPISAHKADAQRLLAAHTDKTRVFAAMFQMRAMPIYRKMRKLVQEGELGEIRRVNWIITTWFRTEAYYASGGWRATWKGEGGGVLLNQCPHTLDLFQWIVGMPVRLRAWCNFGKYHHIEVEDEANAYLEYANGATGLFSTSTAEAPGTNRFEIAGDRGKLVCENNKLVFTRNEVDALEYSRTTDLRFEAPEVWNIDVPFSSGVTSHVHLTQNFVNAILDGEPLMAPAEEGLASVELANAMLYSTFEGREVSLPLDAAAYEAQLKERIAQSQFVKGAVKEGSLDLAGSQP